MAREVDDFAAVPHGLGLVTLLLVLGFAGLIGGAELLVDGGVKIARSFGISEAVIGLTIIAFGTSLPELAASAVAAFRRHGDMALGNIVGSNIFNIVGIVGLVGAITPLDIPARVINMDIWAMALATFLLMPYMIGGRHNFGRIEALLFVVVYGAYIASLAFGVERILPA